MNAWEVALLRIIRERGGKADTQQIYADLESGKFMALRERHLRLTEHGGRPAYQHQVRSHLSNLVDVGDLTRLSRGVYEATEKGQKRE